MLLPLLLLQPGFLLAQKTGLAIVTGNRARGLVEFWAPDQECSLNISGADTRANRCSIRSIDIWEDTIFGCFSVDNSVVGNFSTSCFKLTTSGWQFWKNTLYVRDRHTSAVTTQGLLLVGGLYSNMTTEVIPWEGGESKAGFTLQHGREGHCSIQTSPNTIFLTGGGHTFTPTYTANAGLVTEYSGLGAGEEVTSRELPPLLQPRYDHACGWYSVGDSQVLLVTGGVSPTSGAGATTEVFPLTGPGAGSWRKAGPLPSPRVSFHAAKVGDLLHVLGGSSCSDHTHINEILTWDSVSESWSLTGEMPVALTKVRFPFRVTEVPLAVMAKYCPGNN